MIRVYGDGTLPGPSSQTTSLPIDRQVVKVETSVGYVDVRSRPVFQTRRGWDDAVDAVLEEDADLWQRLAKL
jgi:hypothetical protein